MEQIMEWFKTWFSREDIYYIIVPLAVVVIGWLLQYFKGNRIEKQWKYVSEKSSYDKFCFYCVRVFILGMLVTIIYVAALCAIVVLFIVEPNGIVIKVTYTIVISGAYIFFAKYAEVSNIVFRKFKKKEKYKNEKMIAYIMNKLPHALAWAIWLGMMCGAPLNIARILLIITVVLEIVSMIIIDDARIFKFEYATFHFYEGKSIESIETCNIFQKGDWIIAKDDEEQLEHRFRIKDIKHIVYFNS